MKVVAIDGPAAAGKSTVARAVAERLGWRYLDTGAMYRAIALAVIEKGADPGNAAAVESVARDAKIEALDNRVTLGARDVSTRIRDDDVTQIVSVVAAYPGVRAALIEKQRALLRMGEVVMEGRDIGTVVAPDADIKVYLTAELDERARRRSLQLGFGQEDLDLKSTRNALEARDIADSTRATSPLSRATDAVIVDTTDKAVDEIVGEITAIAEDRFDAR